MTALYVRLTFVYVRVAQFVARHGVRLPLPAGFYWDDGEEVAT